MQQKRIVIILADISGYTQFMLDNRTAAVHGQICINALVDSIVEQVDIPLTLQEIEGDAVFLYAADPGTEDGWQRVLEEVSYKLDNFFDAFIAQLGVGTECTPCPCAICSNADKLGLKIIVHTGEAIFHEGGGRAQVSGPDVILAHRLLKNSLDCKEYLLLTEEAYGAMGEHLTGYYEQRFEDYEEFKSVAVRVRFLEEEFLRARDSVYKLNDSDLELGVKSYADWICGAFFKAALQQWRNPVRSFGWLERALMLFDAIKWKTLFRFVHRSGIPKQLRARGARRTFPTTQ